ncbi:Swi3p, partial [Ascoidea rubescens DSM 1968]
QTHAIVIPSYASWFNFRKVRRVEIESLPDFFDNSSRSKTPLIYIKYRNFMINTYRLNPSENLTVTACRRNLVGDAGSILRIHRFLTKWGLINYQVSPELAIRNVEPPLTDHFKIDTDTPKGLFPFQPYKLPKETDENTNNVEKKINGTKENDIVVSNKKVKTKAFNIKRPNILASLSIDKNSISSWKPEEIKKLLEGVETFNSNWHKIAEFVGTKTPEQCILRFLKLPIEDPYLEKHPEKLGPLKYAPYIPFSAIDNPIMTAIAYLCELVDADIAKSASQNAIKKIERDLIEKLSGGEKVKLKKSINNDDLDPKTEKVPEEPRTDPLDYIKEGTYMAMGSAAARSHIFSRYEEREMHKLIMKLLNFQFTKINLKLEKMRVCEKLLELEKKSLQKFQQEIFLNSLSLAKHSSSINSKLSNAISVLKETVDLFKSSAKFISEAKKLFLNPVKYSVFHDKAQDKSNKSGISSEVSDVNPISVAAPNLYKYWGG